MSDNRHLESTLFWNAVMFYTRLPTPSNLEYSEDVLNRSRKYFTTVGLIIGGIAAISFNLAAMVMPLSVSVLLSMISTILATGCFHEDGFADTCDGLGGGWTKEQVLTIMKDSRLGTYGTIGLLSMLSLKFAILLQLAVNLSGMEWAVIAIASHTVSRWHSSNVVKQFDYVQDIDTSKIKPIANQTLPLGSELYLRNIALLAMIPTAFVSFTGLIAGAMSTYWLSIRFARYSKRRIGGYTGDILGSIQQLSEVTFLLVLLVFSS